MRTRWEQDGNKMGTRRGQDRDKMGTRWGQGRDKTSMVSRDFRFSRVDVDRTNLN